MGCTQHESVQKGLISSLTLEHTDLKSMCLGGSEMVPEALEKEEGRQSGEITRGDSAGGLWGQMLHLEQIGDTLRHLLSAGPQFPCI